MVKATCIGLKPFGRKATPGGHDLYTEPYICTRGVPGYRGLKKDIQWSKPRVYAVRLVYHLTYNSLYALID